MFKPTHDVAQWRVLYDHMKTMDIGETFTHEQMRALLPGVREDAVRVVFQRALREMEDLHQRSFENVRGVGYRMAEPRNHERLARSKHKTARRTLDAALRKTTSADRSQLSEDERRRIDALQQHLTAHKSMLDQLKRRTDKIEDRVAVTEKQNLQLEDRFTLLEERLRRHGLLDAEETDGSVA